MNQTPIRNLDDLISLCCPDHAHSITDELVNNNMNRLLVKDSRGHWLVKICTTPITHWFDTNKRYSVTTFRKVLKDYILSTIRDRASDIDSTRIEVFQSALYPHRKKSAISYFIMRLPRHQTYVVVVRNNRLFITHKYNINLATNKINTLCRRYPDGTHKVRYL